MPGKGRRQPKYRVYFNGNQVTVHRAVHWLGQFSLSVDGMVIDGSDWDKWFVTVLDRIHESLTGDDKDLWSRDLQLAEAAIDNLLLLFRAWPQRLPWLAECVRRSRTLPARQPGEKPWWEHLSRCAHFVVWIAELHPAAWATTRERVANLLSELVSSMHDAVSAELLLRVLFPWCAVDNARSDPARDIFVGLAQRRVLAAFAARSDSSLLRACDDTPAMETEMTIEMTTFCLISKTAWEHGLREPLPIETVERLMDMGMRAIAMPSATIEFVGNADVFLSTVCCAAHNDELLPQLLAAVFDRASDPRAVVGGILTAIETSDRQIGRQTTPTDGLDRQFLYHLLAAATKPENTMTAEQRSGRLAAVLTASSALGSSFASVFLSPPAHLRGAFFLPPVARQLQALRSLPPLPAESEAAEAVRAFIADPRWRRTTCGNPGCRAEWTSLKMCSRCQLVSYCSRECQTKDWSTHKQQCKKEGK